MAENMQILKRISDKGGSSSMSGGVVDKVLESVGEKADNLKKVRATFTHMRHTVEISVHGQTSQAVARHLSLWLAMLSFAILRLSPPPFELTP